MKYFEFDKQEYWALVAAESEKKAYEVYHTEVAGATIADVMAEGKPEELKKPTAFAKYITATIKYGDKEFFEAACDFHSSENKTLLIDSSLA
ncbi:hypothetical protein IK3_03110 [Bacillus toyonensis]|uniref:hypothetical protein n=1 Tax=Bacillus TaxID=1386 RepID=UPI000279E120|nr:MULTISPECIES: hypothetical protein [Bacillus]KNH36171.1 hypothetical protein ACS75_26790 [Bacillus thuringiensis]EJR62790.1 hypothetical protein IK3_03110 [Bacillus toyonensis]MDF9890635.1 hypothetical protein [Bacillus sp. LEw-kw-24]MDH6559306.1 hypothetical protein [Bacillus sp. LEw-kw-2]PEP86136.1 hypothetical protein CN584_08755 [Bacillus pseudomycoides]